MIQRVVSASKLFESSDYPNYIPDNGTSNEIPALSWAGVAA